MLEELPIGYGVDVGAAVLDDDDAADVLPPLVAAADAGADVPPMLPSTVVDSAPPLAVVADVVLLARKEEVCTRIGVDVIPTLDSRMQVLASLLAIVPSEQGKQCPEPLTAL